MPKFVIDPGHGRSPARGRSTAVGSRGTLGARECDVVYQIANALRRKLGAGAVLTRAEEENPSLAERAALARTSRATSFISLHANAGPPGHRGSEIYVHPRARPGSLELARAVRRELGGLGFLAKGVEQADMAVLTPEELGPDVSACLVEVDYLTDPMGERRLTDRRGVEQIAGALARALAGGRLGDGPVQTSDPIRDPMNDPKAPWHSRDNPPDGFVRVHINADDFVDLPAEDTDAMYVDNNIVNFAIQPTPVVLDIDNQPITFYYQDGAELKLPTLSTITDDYDDGTYLTYVAGTRLARCDRNFKPMYNAFTTPRLHWIKQDLHRRIQEAKAEQLAMAQIIAAFAAIIGNYSALEPTAAWTGLSTGHLPYTRGGS
jgi:hypothetical protein